MYRSLASRRFAVPVSLFVPFRPAKENCGNSHAAGDAGLFEFVKVLRRRVTLEKAPVRQFLRVLAASLSVAVLLAAALLQPGLFGTLGLFLIAALIFLLAAAFFCGHKLNRDRAGAN